MDAEQAKRELKRRMLCDKWHDSDVHEELQEARRNWQSDSDDLEDQIASMERVLLEVKYWLHSGLVHHRLVSDPRALLRKVEDVI